MFESYKQTFVDADNYRQNNWKKVQKSSKQEQKILINDFT